jgi:hypothetical protein
MAKHHENNRRIPHSMAAGFARGLHHRVDLIWPQIISL